MSPLDELRVGVTVVCGVGVVVGVVCLTSPYWWARAVGAVSLGMAVAILWDVWRL